MPCYCLDFLFNDLCSNLPIVTFQKIMWSYSIWISPFWGHVFQVRILIYYLVISLKQTYYDGYQGNKQNGRWMAGNLHPLTAFSTKEWKYHQSVWQKLKCTDLFRVYIQPFLQATTMRYSTSYIPVTLKNTGTLGKAIWNTVHPHYFKH